ncbi:MAG: gamma carbonic anhydrase family protein [Burkholderiaceae bacterium]|nr:gamma carbonic anhydrase family protein [Burkholderiaceae bacterium]
MAIFALDHTKPEIDPSAWVDESATIIGEVTLQADVNVWPGARLRGDEAPIIIGAGSNVQDNAVIHCDPGVPCVLGEDVTVGHGAILHSCTVGDRTLIGMGAIIMNRTVIGNDTLVAAGTLIGEGKSFPDGVLIMGRPGKIVRELTPEERKNLTISAHHYRQQKVRYETGLKPLELSTKEQE